MELIKYKNNIHKGDWDQYVLNSNNGTIFHLRKFLSYHEDRAFQDSSLIFSENNQIIALFTGAIIQDSLHSHPGASFGGFVYNNISYKACQQIINLLLKYTQEQKLNKIIIVPPPFIYYQKYNESMEYCLGINKFKTTEYYISSFVELNQDPIKLIHNRKKRYINKLKDAVEIKESNDLDAFYPILLDNKSRHNVKPTHSLSELKILKNSFPNKIKLLLSYKNKTVIGGALMFITNDNSCILFYNMIDYKYQDLQVASLQIYESLNWAKKNKIQFFDIGVSQIYENEKIIPHESLINFKEQFGAQAMIRKVMERNF
tara:strand:- start:20 stop:967 length:948 start_codon:yes stop_codon:yes gene_type:complete